MTPMTRTASGTRHDGSATDGVHDLIAFIRPRSEELRWREVPWQTDLHAACRIATERDLPMFLWAMNGNALGCT